MTPSSDPRNYARFIPKEELGEVAQWRFGAVGSAYTPEQLDQRRAEAERSRQNLLLAEKDAYARGLAEGRAQAQAEARRLCDAYIEDQGRAAAEATAQQLADVVLATQRGLEAADQRLAQGVLELSCAIARQVLRHELSVDPLAIRHVVAEALGLLTGDARTVTLRLHPEDLGLLKAPLEAAFTGHTLNFVADASVQRGDCRIESAGAVIDGSLERRWAHAVSGLGLPQEVGPAPSYEDQDAS